MAFFHRVEVSKWRRGFNGRSLWFYGITIGKWRAIGVILAKPFDSTLPGARPEPASHPAARRVGDDGPSGNEAGRDD